MGNTILYIFLFFKLIIELSIISIIPITVVIITNKVLKNKMAFKFQYILSLLILLRLLVPMMPKTSLSIFNEFTIDKSKDVVVDILATSKVENQFYNNNFDFAKINKTASYTTNIENIKLNITHLFILWQLVVIVLAFYNILVYRKFYKNVKLSKTLNYDNINLIINDIKKTLNINKSFRIVELDSINSPAIFISKTPTILLPKDLSKDLKFEDLKNILFHELCHYKRKDMIPLYLIKLISIIYWFNPLILYALKECKKALELSCDEMVLSHIGQEEKLSYGNTIISLIDHTKNSINPSMALTMMGSKKQIAHRIKFIRDFKKKTILSKSLSIIVIILISTILFTEGNAVASPYISDAVSWKYVIDKEGRIKRVDDINLPFKEDNEVLGKWVSVDFVHTIDNFDPHKRYWKEDLFLKDLEFLPNGKTPFKWSTWTKNFVIHYGNKTASRYYIKTIAGYDYMFFEWKSGDYTFRHRNPCYYVLKREGAAK